MKVLMFSTDATILEPGSDAYGRMREYGALADRLDIIVCTSGSPKQELAISGNTRAISTNSSLKLWYVRDLLRVAKRFVPGDIDIVTSQDPFETGLAGWLAARRLKARLQIQVHTDFLSPYFSRESFKNKIRVMLAQWLLPKAHSIRVVSERIRASLLELGLPEEKIDVLPVFSSVASVGGTVNLHKKYPQFGVILLAVSRLEPEKNINLTIRAFSEVAKKYPASGLVIVGSGSQEQPLKRLAARLAPSGAVAFEGRVVSAVPYYAYADVFINTSNYEGYGRTLVEAAQAGLPVITTDVGLAGELFNNENSIIVPVGDQESLELAMSDIVEHADIRTKLSAAVAVAVASLPSKEQLLTRHKQLWQNIQNAHS